MACVLFHTARICNSLFKCNYLKNEKLFFNFLFHFWNLHQILNILKERITVIANVFSKLQTMKSLVRTLSKKRRLRARFDRQHLKASKILAKSPWERFFHIFSSFSHNFIWKMPPLVLREILGVFVNILTCNAKYSVQDSDNLPLPIQMQLSEKRKTFSRLFVPFLESTSNFKRFQEKDNRHS